MLPRANLYDHFHRRGLSMINDTLAGYAHHFPFGGHSRDVDSSLLTGLSESEEIRLATAESLAVATPASAQRDAETVANARQKLQQLFDLYDVQEIPIDGDGNVRANAVECEYHM